MKRPWNVSVLLFMFCFWFVGSIGGVILMIITFTEGSNYFKEYPLYVCISPLFQFVSSGAGALFTHKKNPVGWFAGLAQGLFAIIYGIVFMKSVGATLLGAFVIYNLIVKKSRDYYGIQLKHHS